MTEPIDLPTFRALALSLSLHSEGNGEVLSIGPERDCAINLDIAFGQLALKRRPFRSQRLLVGFRGVGNLDKSVERLQSAQQFFVFRLAGGAQDLGAKDERRLATSVTAETAEQVRPRMHVTLLIARRNHKCKWTDGS